MRPTNLSLVHVARNILMFSIILSLALLLPPGALQAQSNLTLTSATTET